MNSKQPEQECKLHEELIYCGIVRSCLNCELFNRDLETCQLAGARPPVKVVVFGCPKWTLDIPF